jgi:hypothetical protein
VRIERAHTLTANQLYHPRIYSGRKACNIGRLLRYDLMMDDIPLKVGTLLEVFQE